MSIEIASEAIETGLSYVVPLSLLRGKQLVGFLSGILKFNEIRASML
jgi:hypothetical protein